MAEACDEPLPHGKSPYAHQYMFVLTSGNAKIVWGDTVTQADDHFAVKSAGGEVLQQFSTRDVVTWREITLRRVEEDQDGNKPTGSDTRDAE